MHVDEAKQYAETLATCCGVVVAMKSVQPRTTAYWHYYDDCCVDTTISIRLRLR